MEGVFIYGGVFFCYGGGFGLVVLVVFLWIVFVLVFVLVWWCCCGEVRE